ncbi:MAG: universal stress protein [Candidatus Eremiobacteraeota bacterium]|nr:universal stress protein [Candidatus Eremiobacteraeota bacterium]MBV9264077.1 universal stress protein [Candidatus Eremiobacteraeota bacterium]
MITLGSAHVSIAGILAAILIAGGVGSTLYWMLNTPQSYVQKIAKKAETELAEMVGSLIVAFSPEIDSSHMVALAVKLARGEKSELLALYIIEVPYTLPPDAAMPAEERIALDALGAAETIAGKNNVAIRTETIKARSTKQAVLDVAKREKANLIMLGSFREGKYSGAPLSRIIEEIAADAKCDVLIGVEGKHGTLLLTEDSVQSTAQTA